MDGAEELSEDYWPFESKKSPEKNLSQSLKNVNISMLGVSGMGGVGKNIFSEKVDRRVIEYLFKVFVEVSETPDLKGILRVRVLLISDDVWNDLDLKTLRISSIVWSLFRKTPDYSRNGKCCYY
ncbi:uncharacterized protein LOC123220875 isoform X2 [Mangifera indica]|uniref:uncharacterized protein LOC123220875 isoform X2 n=1 Tax=Mangifera indica TaxID=29780 RepID=UPI001CF93BA1|nr:uncharacterized protein LOC123220875 isoform X2 [Mangifera indica]